MLLIIGVLAALAVAVTLMKVRVPGGVDTAKLGWMSDHWLAENRVSHHS
jgi:hypothetical protein